MKIKIKCIYKDKVEPTILKEVDISDDTDKEQFLTEANTLLQNLLDPCNEVEGLFISNQ